MLRRMFLILALAAAGPCWAQTTWTVGNETEWITAVNGASAASMNGDPATQIIITGSFSVNSQIVLNANVTIASASGQNYTITGNGDRILFIAGGTVNISNLGFAGGTATGGVAHDSGGGGAGMGGAIFVGNGSYATGSGSALTGISVPNVTFTSVSFTGNTAQGGGGGGSGGGGGGGGMGGDAGEFDGWGAAGGGGGGFGNGATGGSGAGVEEDGGGGSSGSFTNIAGVLPGGSGGDGADGNNGGGGGANGGGGGGGGAASVIPGGPNGGTGAGGGLGGAGGHNANEEAPNSGGDGGFGGGGGGGIAGFGSGGNGGFGGGGGGGIGDTLGGNGGFGGGAGASVSSSNGTAGNFGGAGSGENGGAGASLGGGLFVMNGATVTLIDTTFDANAVTPTGNASAYGADAFLGGNITVSVSSGNTQTMTSLGGTGMAGTDPNVSVDAVNVVGGLSKDGDGTLLLGGASTYVGSTVVHFGTLQLASTASETGTSGVVVGESLGDDGTLLLSGNASLQASSPTTITLGADAGAQGTLLIGDGTGTPSLTNFSQILVGGGAGVVVVNVAGSIQLPTVTGQMNLTLVSGTISMGPQNGLGSVISGATIINSATMQVAPGESFETSGTIVVGDADGDSGALVAYGNNLGGSEVTAAGVILGQADGAVGTLTIGNGAGSFGPTWTVPTVSSGAGTGSIIFSQADATYEFRSVISGNIGVTIQSGGITKLAPTAENTYTGGTNVQSGTLRAGNANALPQGGTVSVDSGATLDVAGVAVTLSGLQLEGSLIDSAGGGSVNAGSVTLQSGAASSVAITTPSFVATNSTISGSVTSSNVNISGGALTASLAVGSGSIGTNLTGSASLTVNGASGNSVALNGAANTYTGATKIDSGKLVVGAGVSISGTSSLTVGTTMGQNATLALGSNASLTLGGFGNDTDAPIVLGTVAGATGTITIGGGANTNGANIGARSIQGGAGGGTVNFQQQYAYQNVLSEIYVFLPAMSGNLSVVQNGPGTTALGPNTFTGATTIQQGGLQLGTTGALASTSGVTLEAAGTLILAASNTINDSAEFTWNGGTVQNIGILGVTELLGDTTISTSAILDAGATAFDLTFTTLDLQASVAVWNWKVGVDFLGVANGALTGSASQFVFYSDDGQTEIGVGQLSGSEIIVVPEPSTWALALLGLAALAHRRRGGKAGV
jgi:autotransporter-associated beta strand protein